MGERGKEGGREEGREGRILGGICQFIGLPERGKKGERGGKGREGEGKRGK